MCSSSGEHFLDLFLGFHAPVSIVIGVRDTGMSVVDLQITVGTPRAWKRICQLQVELSLLTVRYSNLCLNPPPVPNRPHRLYLKIDARRWRLRRGEQVACSSNDATMGRKLLVTSTLTIGGPLLVKQR